MHIEVTKTGTSLSGEKMWRAIDTTSRDAALNHNARKAAALVWGRGKALHAVVTVLDSYGNTKDWYSLTR